MFSNKCSPMFDKYVSFEKDQFEKISLKKTKILQEISELENACRDIYKNLLCKETFRSKIFRLFPSTGKNTIKIQD